VIHELLLYLHVVGACVLLGTGTGIAFFMLVSIRSADPALIAHTAGIVVLGDAIFTATAAVLQPVTGLLLAQHSGWSLLEGWVFTSLMLYVAVGALWLPVFWIQFRLKQLAVAARDSAQPLPAAFYRLYRIWFACGVPAFLAVLAILLLMVVKPTI
jgi:uncharacterized membrane protein